MHDYFFLLQPPNPDGSRTVFAASRDIYETTGRYEGLAALYAHENSRVAWTSADAAAAWPAISPAEARERHPALFEEIERRALAPA